jgi:hypothetical protein
MTKLKPETVAFLKSLDDVNKGAGLAGKWGSRTALRGSRQRHPYMGRARLYAQRRMSKAFDHFDERGEPRDGKGRWTQTQRLAYATSNYADEAEHHQQEALKGRDVLHHKAQQASFLRAALAHHRAALVSFGNEGRADPALEAAFERIGDRLVRLMKGRSVEPRDPHGRWAQETSKAITGLKAKLKRLDFLHHDNLEDDRGSGQFFTRLAAKIASKVKKDLGAGDVHLTSALGGDQPRRKRKYPPLSLARLPNGQVNA